MILRYISILFLITLFFNSCSMTFFTKKKNKVDKDKATVKPQEVIGTYERNDLYYASLVGTSDTNIKFFSTKKDFNNVFDIRALSPKQESYDFIPIVKQLLAKYGEINLQTLAPVFVVNESSDIGNNKKVTKKVLKNLRAGKKASIKASKIKLKSTLKNKNNKINDNQNIYAKENTGVVSVIKSNVNKKLNLDLSNVLDNKNYIISDKFNVIYSALVSGVLSAVSFDNMVLWKVKTPSLFAGPIIAKDNLIVLSDNGMLLAYNRFSGAKIWENKVGIIGLNNIKTNGREIIIQGVDGVIASFSVEDGKQLWRNQVLISNFNFSAQASLILNDDIVVAGFANGIIVVYDIASGKERNRLQIMFKPAYGSEVDKLVDLDGGLLKDDGILFLGSIGGKLMALELETGNIKWQVNNIRTYKEMVLIDNKLIVLDADSRVLALDVENGKIAWIQEKMQGRVIGNPNVIKPYSLVLISDYAGYIYLLNADNGKIVSLESVDRKEGIGKELSVLKDKVFLVSNKGELIGYKIVRVNN